MRRIIDLTFDDVHDKMHILLFGFYFVSSIVIMIIQLCLAALFACSLLLVFHCLIMAVVKTEILFIVAALIISVASGLLWLFLNTLGVFYRIKGMMVDMFPQTYQKIKSLWTSEKFYITTRGKNDY